MCWQLEINTRASVEAIQHQIGEDLSSILDEEPIEIKRTLAGKLMG